MAGRYGSVVVRDRDCDENGPGSNPGLGFPFLLIETLSKRSVLEMEATVYERDNCHGDLLLQQIIVSCLLQKIVHVFVSDQTCSIIIKAQCGTWPRLFENNNFSG